MRIRFSVALTCLIFTLLAGAAVAEQVTLKFVWPTYTTSKVRYGEELVRQFEAANPDIAVDLQLVGNPYETLTVRVAGGSPPDVVWLGAGWHQYIPLFRPLDDLVARDAAEMAPGDFIPGIWNIHVWEGKRYAIPTGYQTLAGFYNKDRYQEAGLPFPTDDWTMSDLIEHGRVLTQDTSGDGKPDRWGVSWHFGGQSTTFALYGGQVANEDWTKVRINNPVTYEALSLYRDLEFHLGIAPPGHGNQGMIESGNIGFFASGIWLSESLGQVGNFDWDYVDYPLLTVAGEGHRGTILYPEELVIVNSTEHPEEAWRLIKFATGVEHLAWAAREGHIVPGRFSVLQSDNFQRGDKRMNVWYTSVEYAHEQFPHPLYTDLNRVWSQNWARMGGANATVDIRSGLEIMNDQMQALLDEYNARR